MSHDLEAINKHVKACFAVFIALLGLTAVTVAISYLDVSTGMAIVIALIVASVKATLVVLYFMHLISEEKLIYLSLGITCFFFLGLLILLYGSEIDIVQYGTKGA